MKTAEDYGAVSPRASKSGRLFHQRAVAAGALKGEQVFPPRTVKPRQTPRFLVPAGTPCKVKKVTDNAWRPHVTTKTNGFERFERWERGQAGGYFEFRGEAGWLMLVAARFVSQRSAASGMRTSG